MAVEHQKLLGRWIEYIDKNEAVRIGKAVKIYGGRVTMTMKYHRITLHLERVHPSRLLRVKVWRKWIPVSEYLSRIEKNEVTKDGLKPSTAIEPASSQPA